MPMQDIKISVVIVTFNSGHCIENCLSSVFFRIPAGLEVIVVDNGSSDETVRKIKKAYPDVRVLENKENLGACKARNQAIDLCSGEWVFTLDCDCYLPHDFFENIFAYLKDVPDDVGEVQPKILKIDKQTIYSCGIHLSRVFNRFYDIGQGRSDTLQFNRTLDIFGACCAAAFYRRAMLKQLKETTGYFDERFFFLVEDVDLSWRAQKKGWKAVFIPQAVCYHSGNSSNSDKKLREFLCVRNRYYLISKNKGALNYCKRVLPLFLYDLPRLFYLFLFNRRVRRNLRQLKDSILNGNTRLCHENSSMP